MSIEEIGIYILLLSEQWDSDDCTLPADDDQLIDLLGRQVTELPAKVMQCFQFAPSDHDKIFSPRLRSIWDDHIRVHKARSDAGKNTAKLRGYGDTSLPSSSPTKSASRSAPANQIQNQIQNKKREEEPVNPVDNNGKPPKGCQLPQDFALTPEMEAYARSKGIQDVATEFEHFQNYHLANGSVKKNWLATWRTWCLNFAKFKPKGMVGGDEDEGERKKRVWQEKNREATLEALERTKG